MDPRQETKEAAILSDKYIQTRKVVRVGTVKRSPGFAQRSQVWS